MTRGRIPTTAAASAGLGGVLALAPGAGMAASPRSEQDASTARFEALQARGWTEVMHDPCTEDWRRRWTLDGEKATLEHDADGMTFTAGPEFGEDSSHAVLWTRQSFEGPIRIDYEYTKTDDTARAVTILYVLATGSGEEPYVEDISAWSELRRVPAMSMYFNHMDTYHVSYAAYDQDNDDPGNDYIRARRYLPAAGGGLAGTDLEPSYFETGLFAKGVPHRVTVIQWEDDLFFLVRNDRRQILCHWRTDAFPPIEAGRIGLRHMYTRSARYRDFRVSVPSE